MESGSDGILRIGVAPETHTILIGTGNGSKTINIGTGPGSQMVNIGKQGTPTTVDDDLNVRGTVRLNYHSGGKKLHSMGTVSYVSHSNYNQATGKGQYAMACAHMASNGTLVQNSGGIRTFKVATGYYKLYWDPAIWNTVQPPILVVSPDYWKRKVKGSHG